VPSFCVGPGAGLLLAELLIDGATLAADAIIYGMVSGEVVQALPCGTM